MKNCVDPDQLMPESTLFQNSTAYFHSALNFKRSIIVYDILKMLFVDIQLMHFNA